MLGNDANSSPSQNDNTNNSSADYLNRAAQACAAGDVVLGLHLYLAAYERANRDSQTPKQAVIEGLHHAWHLACQYKERSLAEYIFEKLEPYLTPDEVARHAAQLQQLALDKLEEFGLTREDLEDMTDMISQDFLGFDPSTWLLRVESGEDAQKALGPLRKNGSREASKGQEAALTPEAPQDALEDSRPHTKFPITNGRFDITQFAASIGSPDDRDAGIKPALSPLAFDGKAPDSEAAGLETVSPVEASAAAERAEQPASAGQPESKTATQAENLAANVFAPSPLGVEEPKVETTTERMTYRDLIGYEKAIEAMNGFGIGMGEDPRFRDLVNTLNSQHGLSRVPITDTFLFRSPVREDANQFMVATMGEIDLPAIRMRMEENLQGMPVLCVMASAENHPQLNAARNAIEGGGVLLLEDIDLWGSPYPEVGNPLDDVGGFMQAQLSRGAREAINLIRSAVENPDVYVLMSSAQDSPIDSFFYDMLEPLTVVDIASPNDAERADLWIHIAGEHPSLRSIDRAALVRYSAGMSRFDIYMAARESVEEAYKASLMARRFIPVNRENIFEKIAAYQPLESSEYRQLEDAVVDGFKTELENIDDLLKGSEE